MVCQIKSQACFHISHWKALVVPKDFLSAKVLGVWSRLHVQLPCRPILLLPDHYWPPFYVHTNVHISTQMCTNVHKCTQICPHVRKQKWWAAQQICKRLLHFLCAGNKQCMHVQPFTSVEHKACTFGQTQQILLRQDNDNLFIQGLVDPVQPAHKSEKNVRHLFWNYELFSPTQSVTMPIIIESLWMIKKYP